MTVARVLAELSRGIDASFDPEAVCVVRHDPAGSLTLTPRTPWLELELELAQPLALELAIQRLRDEDLWDFFHDPPIVFDQPAFDDAFLVRGEPEESVRVLLDTETRALLLRLRSLTSELSLDRAALRLALPLHALSAERLPELVELCEDALALGRRLIGVASAVRSAYR